MKRAPLTEAERAQVEVNRNALLGVLYAICLPWAIGYWTFQLLDWLFGL